jgi:hypothetical protein
MKGKLLITMVILVLSNRGSAQARFEQYAYLEKNKPATWVPVVQYESGNQWHAEARYNYESTRTFSLYIGKTFSHQTKLTGLRGPSSFPRNYLSYSVTPLVGGVVGNFKGGSAGLNLTVDYRDIFFSSQSQYTFSGDSESLNFFFSWSELVYQAKRWIYLGLSAQSLYFNEINNGSFETGVVIGFEFGKWTFPLYAFNLGASDTYFVAGINLDLGKIINNGYGKPGYNKY